MHNSNSFFLIIKVSSLIIFSIFSIGNVFAVEEDKEISDLLQMDFQQLSDIVVTSVSKKEEKLFESASAVYVITQEDLRRTGVATIMEALRMAPGMDVASVDSNKWAISARGFNDLFARKLLVLIDGRTVYTPVFSGVYWDVQDTPIEDVERIEIIRGPGGTLWGANAMNGVINIITKHAKDTKGGLISAGVGNVENGFGTIRYGSQVGEKIHFRAYGKYFDRDGFETVSGAPENNDWDAIRGGFRADWDISDSDSLTLQGDYYNGDSRQEVTGVFSLTNAPFTFTRAEDSNLEGGNILARWNHTFSSESNFSLQMYYDRAEREEVIFNQTVDTLDVDFQHTFKIKDVQVIWGIGYRTVSDYFDNTTFVSFGDTAQANDTPNAFIQGEYFLIKDQLRVTLGSKFQIDPFTGFQAQPSARLLWTPNEQHVVWGAISRAVRTPSRVEDNFNLNSVSFPLSPFPPPYALVPIMGSPEMKAEEMLAFELGYRYKSSNKLSIDVTAFLHDYDNLLTAENLPSGAIPPNFITFPVGFDNQMSGEGYGVEVAGVWAPLDFWKLNMSLSWHQMKLYLDPTSTDTTQEDLAGNSPEYKFHVRSYLDLPHNLELDASFYYVDNLPSLAIPSYTRVDVRLGWTPFQKFELSLALQNLGDSSHPEYSAVDAGGIKATRVPRTVYGKATWRF
ncbi:MAG: TonB-dependent receptor plug domain-containing protein [Nitrospinales bacterium]